MSDFSKSFPAIRVMLEKMKLTVPEIVSPKILLGVLIVFEQQQCKCQC